jgi:hypothetical protein
MKQLIHLFLSLFTCSLPQLAWEKGFDDDVVVVDCSLARFVWDIIQCVLPFLRDMPDTTFVLFGA